jgi:hypothetical protein
MTKPIPDKSVADSPIHDPGPRYHRTEADGRRGVGPVVGPVSGPIWTRRRTGLRRSLLLPAFKFASTDG